MAKMVVIYKHPSNPQAFDEHYFGVHIPLAKKLPGLREVRSQPGGRPHHESEGPLRHLPRRDAPLRRQRARAFSMRSQARKGGVRAGYAEVRTAREGADVPFRGCRRLGAHQRAMSPRAIRLATMSLEM